MSFAEKLSRLQAFLDADDLHEEALDYVATHGYLTALSICPEQVPEREWIDALFAEPPHYRSDEERQEIETSLEQLKAHITRVLASDEDLELPCDLDLGDEPDDSDLRGWCIGFMEGVFLREEVWFRPRRKSASCCCLSWSAPACSTSSPSSTRSPATATWWTTWSRRFPTC